MRAPRVSSDEQYRLVMECRSSGMTDYQWCMEHHIKPGTFYNWVKRLRARDNPVPGADKTARVPAKQEVVKVDLPKPINTVKCTQPAADFSTNPAEPQYIPAAPAMEVAVAGAVLRIPNGTDPVLLEQVVRILRAAPC